MAVAQDRQKLPSPENTGRNLSNDASRIRPYPVTSNSDALEDGEIVEGRFSSISSQPLPQQYKARQQLRSSNHSTPTFPSAKPEPAASLALAVEPSNLRLH